MVYSTHRGRKRRADEAGEVPAKRTRCGDLSDISEHSEVSVEDFRVRRAKRKASVDASTTEKKRWCSINTTDSSPASMKCLCCSRKADHDGDISTTTASTTNSPNSTTTVSTNSTITLSSNSTITLSTNSRTTITLSSTTSLSMMDFRERRGKRKASVDASTSENKRRSSINTTDSSPVSRCLRKSKGDRDGNTSTTTDTTTDTTTSSTPTSPSSTTSSSGIYTISASTTDSSIFDARAALNLGRVSAEEEKIYRLSSSANTNRDEFEDKYILLAPIGKGGFGSVYDGLRKSDCLPVAIKHIPANKVKDQKVMCNGKVYTIIVEVALLLKSAGPIGQSAAVALLDWYFLDNKLILVMEKPPCSMDLKQHLKLRNGALDEREAKAILKQLVDAAVHMHSKGIFHRDIKLHNVLLQWDCGVPRVRVIDFGCGTFSTDEDYSSFSGTLIYAPPEWFDYYKYRACPSTVWQLGALFYCLLGGYEYFSTKNFINKRIEVNKELSTDCQILLHLCLTRDPTKRISLKMLQQHRALMLD